MCAPAPAPPAKSPVAAGTKVGKPARVPAGTKVPIPRAERSVLQPGWPLPVSGHGHRDDVRVCRRPPPITACLALPGDRCCPRDLRSSGHAAAWSRGRAVPGGPARRHRGAPGPAVHALLRYLERVGFAGAPRVVGDGFDDQGHEVLTFVEGAMVSPYAWSDDGIEQTGQLLRALHGATE